MRPEIRKRSWILAAFGLALIAVVVGYLGSSGGQDGLEAGLPPRTVADSAHGDLDPPACDEDAQELAQASSTSRRSTEVEAARVPASEKPTLTGRVLDRRGLPVAGATVEALDTPNASFNNYDLEFEPEVSVRSRASTGAEGHFRLELQPHRPFDLVARAEGFASARLEACYAGQHVELRLGRACELIGLITEAGGTPVPDVRLRVFGEDVDRAVEGRCAADGRYRIGGLVAGEAWLQVIPMDHAMPRLIQLELRPQQPTRQDVELEAGRTLTGQVRDARNGRGIAQAEVSSWSFLGKTVRTDAQGYYRLRGVRTLRGSLAARAEGYGRGEAPLPADAEQVDFELQPARAVSGRVVDPSGEALAGALVSVCGNAGDGNLQRVEWRTTTSEVDGTFQIGGLRKDVQLLLFVRLEGHASLTQEIPMYEVQRETLELGDVVLRPHAVLAGRVVDHAGRPAADMHLQLRGPAGAAGYGTDISTYIHLRSTWTDGGGRFSVADLAAGEYEASLSAPESCPEARSFILGQGEERTGVEWVLAATGEVRGRVLGPDGKPLERASLVLQSSDESPGPSSSTFSDPRGEFALERLCAGSYSLRVSAGEGWSGERPLAPLVVHDVDTDGRVLELRMLEADSEISGLVVDESGLGIPSALVSIDPGDGSIQGSVLTDAAGHYELQVPSGAQVDLRAWRTRPLDPTQGTPTVLELRLGRRVLHTQSSPASLDGVPSGSRGIELRIEAD